MYRCCVRNSFTGSYVYCKWRVTREPRMLQGFTSSQCSVDRASSSRMYAAVFKNPEASVAHVSQRTIVQTQQLDEVSNLRTYHPETKLITDCSKLENQIEFSDDRLSNFDKLNSSSEKFASLKCQHDYGGSSRNFSTLDILPQFQRCSQRLNFDRIFVQTWNTRIHGRQKELWQAVRASIFIQCSLDGNDINNAMKILEHCERMSRTVEDEGSREAYTFLDLDVINQLLFSFSAMKPKNLEYTLRTLGKLSDWRQKLRCASNGNLTTVYGLLLVLVRHWENLSVKVERTQRLHRVLTQVVQKEIHSLVAQEKLNLEDILIERHGRYKLLRAFDTVVIERLKQLFSDVEPKIPPLKGTDTYKSPILSDYADTSESVHLDQEHKTCSRTSFKIDNKPVEQCKTGFQSEARTDLSTCSCNNFGAAQLPHLDYGNLRKWSEEQLKIEENTYIRLPYLKRKQKSTAMNLLDFLCLQWEASIREGFRLLMKEIDTANDMEILRPFFKILDFESYVRLMVYHLNHIIFDMSSHLTTRTEWIIKGLLIKDLNRSVTHKIMERNGFNKKVLDAYQSYLQALSTSRQKSTSTQSVLCHRQLWYECCMSLFNEPLNKNIECIPMIRWPRGLSSLVCGPLVELMWDSAVMFEDVHVANEHFLRGDFDQLKSLKMVSAFCKEANRMSESRTFAIVPSKPLQILLRQQTKDKLDVTVAAAYLPMLSPPVPRRNVEHSTVGERAISECSDQLAPVFDAVNILSAVPWNVNKPVFDIAIEISESGSTNKKLAVPIPEHQWPTHIERAGGTVMAQKRLNKEVEDPKQLFEMARQAYRNKMLHVQLSTQKYLLMKKLSVVHWLRDKTFWFPNNLDFRGRAYPTSTWFSHIGPDIDRGMLLFAEGRPLGGKEKVTGGTYEYDGLDWLKIHLANLDGTQKRKALPERVRFVEENMANVLESAKNPLNYRWWQNFEAPWQAIATCIEISNAVNSGRPESYVCCLPVHQDGSCNGLQHFAAIGRDLGAAVEVNLVNSSRPGDIYQRVADLMEENRRVDAAKGHGVAKLCEGLIDRSVAKQPVMTSVYGVTRHGVRSQISRALKSTSLPVGIDRAAVSSYVGDLALSAIKTVFFRSKLIQDWLEEVTKCVTYDMEQPMQWRTPLGLPVVQPYKKFDYGSVDYSDEAQKSYERLKEADLAVFQKCFAQRPDKRKHIVAVSPNYIHSLDSTHMLLTALYCARAGVTFASVHDSYWTHPCSVNTMNRICREQFFKLHSMDLLADISSTLEPLALCELNNSETSMAKRNAATYLLHLLRKKRPEQGALNLEDVKNTAYFFS